MENDSGNLPQMLLKPVGLVRSEIITTTQEACQTDTGLEERMDRVREYHQKVKTTVSELHIFTEWEELLEGIDGFSHILVLYWPHLLGPERRNIKKVHPRGRKDLPMQGVFATCSPARPNPVLVSAVPLVERTGNILKVKGLEAVDGSPIIDIKPYVRHYDGTDRPKVPAWMEQIQEEMDQTAVG